MRFFPRRLRAAPKPDRAPLMRDSNEVLAHVGAQMGENRDVTPPTLAPSSAAAAPSLPAPDAVAAAAVDLARAAAEDVALPGTVGDYVGAVSEGVRLVTHRFECTAPGYRGWRWSVTVARAPRARVATVCEAVLLPAQDAVLAPPWLPWSERVAPGDLGVSDVLAYRSDDPLLEPGYTATGEEDADRLALWELGLGRVRVLSREGREDAARRWYEGSHGPTADVAVHASAACSTCGYFLELAGSMRQVFGVCANEWSPSEGTVVSVDHGCGAHSESDVEASVPEPAGTVLDDGAIDVMVLDRAVDPDDIAPEATHLSELSSAPLLDALESQTPVVLTPGAGDPVAADQAHDVVTDDVVSDDVVTDEVATDDVMTHVMTDEVATDGVVVVDTVMDEAATDDPTAETETATAEGDDARP